MMPENLVPQRSEIQEQLVLTLQNLPPQAKGRKGIENALRNRLKAKYKNLPAEDIEKILTDLASYEGVGQPEAYGRQV